MERHGATIMIKTYKGLLQDGGVDRIRLRTLKGHKGYRISKFQIIGGAPGASNYEAVVSISKIDFTPIATIDFTDGDYLAAAFYAGNAAAFNYPTSQVIVFDREMFNQDIYIGLQDLQNNTMNYYLELEQMDLNENETTMATLQSLRRFALPRN
jgi:hypothetical protein